MSDYSFRLRIVLPKSVEFNWNESSVDLANLERGNVLTLRSFDGEKPISDSKELVIEAFGWDSEVEAQEVGLAVRTSFIRALALVGYAADFGFRNPITRFTQHGLNWLEGKFGGRILGDKLGLTVYTSTPTPRFAKMNSPSIISSNPVELLEFALSNSLKNFQALSPQEEIAYGLYASSFFAHSEDARFLNLMMAVEALLIPKPRSKTASDFVTQLIIETKENEQLSEADKQSLVSSLNWLRNESISKMGRDLARARLGNRSYKEMSPDKFFTHCYEFRSRLVHASDPLPSRDDIAVTAAQLEKLVSNLLAGPLLDMEI